MGSELAIGLLWLAAGSVADAADGPPEPWEDTLSVRAPTSPYAALQGASLIGQDTVVFGDLQLGTPLLVSSHFVLGLGVQAQSASIWTADDRAATGLRSLGPDLWFSFPSRERRSVHSVVLRFRGTFEDARTRWFRTSPSEIGTRLGIAYDGYADLGAVHLSVEANLGFAATTIGDLGVSGVLLVPIGDRFALGAGVASRANFQVTTPTVMARVRPVDGLEIGVGVAQAFFSDPSGLTPYPILDVKGYL